MRNLGSMFALLGLCTVAVVLIIGVVAAFGLAGALILIALCPFYGLIFYSFVYYRLSRREELLHVLAGAVEDGMPLGAAVRAYVHDRPGGQMREFWLATLLSFVLPGYYWIWHRRSSFDRKVAELGRQLDLGVPLWRALESSPALAGPEAILAAAVGESSGELRRCLGGVADRRLQTRWLDLVPKLVYPVAMLLVLGATVVFFGIFVVPKYERLLAEFDSELPAISRQLAVNFDRFRMLAPFALAVLAPTLLLTALVMLSSHVRWFFPFFGGVYRRTQRSRVLRALGLLLAVGKPVPESLRILATLPLPRVARRRIRFACAHIELGEPLAASFMRAGLLTGNMAPLVGAAERAGNLPWALGEMADTLYQRTSRRLIRIVQTIFPLSVILVGGLAGYVVVAIFVPLIQLLTELNR